MDEQNNKPQEQEEREPYTPASPAKRILAWVGVAYMVIIILLNLYAFTNQGGMIRGIGPLMLCPAVAGLGVLSVLRYRSGQSRGGLVGAVFMVGLCAVVFIGGLVVGIPALLGQLGG